MRIHQRRKGRRSGHRPILVFPRKKKIYGLSLAELVVTMPRREHSSVPVAR